MFVHFQCPGQHHNHACKITTQTKQTGQECPSDEPIKTSTLSQLPLTHSQNTALIEKFPVHSN